MNPQGETAEISDRERGRHRQFVVTVITARQSFSLIFFSFGIMYSPMNVGLYVPEKEKAPFLGLRLT